MPRIFNMPPPAFMLLPAIWSTLCEASHAACLLVCISLSLRRWGQLAGQI